MTRTATKSITRPTRCGLGGRVFSGRQGLRQWTPSRRSDVARPSARRVLVLRAAVTSAGTAATAGLATAGLATSAFIELSQNDSADGKGTDTDKDKDTDTDTGEKRLLAASRTKLRQLRLQRQQGKRQDGQDGTVWALVRRAVGYLDVHIVEPVLTALRFLHLVTIFVPVVAAVPAVWYGRRDHERDNERSGTLWWYSLLVRSMELAGPAFIKVGKVIHSLTSLSPFLSLLSSPSLI